MMEETKNLMKIFLVSPRFYLWAAIIAAGCIMAIAVTGN